MIKVQKLNENEGIGPIAYWMSRDQRISDNKALLYAQNISIETNKPLVVFFCLVPEFLGATIRQYGFMLKGLQEIENKISRYNIPFYLLTGNPIKEIPKFIEAKKIKLLVNDFDPLEIKRKWKKSLAKKIQIPFYEVDAHNIVPCWEASKKQEWAARTLRPKIKKLLKNYLKELPKLKKQKINWGKKSENKLVQTYKKT